jgi:Zn-dependent M28 family amino/carboxypeptidase
VNGGTARGEALAEEYNVKHYHQPSDEWQANWDWSGVAENGALLHDVGLRLANSREWPNWSADSEFRAARDATASERKGTAPPAAPAAMPAAKGERG